MNRVFVSTCCLVLIFGCCLAQDSRPGVPEIDWNKARRLLQKSRNGETLSPEDQKFLNLAREVRRQRGARAGSGTAQRKAPDRLIPLTDMSEKDRYEGQDGGLYGEGRNEPTGEHLENAKAQLAAIRPLDAEGKPSANGRIVFISISMSNATQEFSRFKQIADQAPEKNDLVTIVDCAQGGKAMREWSSPEAPPWTVAMARLEKAGVSARQVQVAWVKLANKSPRGSLQDHGKKLENDTLLVLKNAKAKFPNLKIAYLGSRIWAGNAKGNLNPEPYAYESAFVVRWLIQRQISKDPELLLNTVPLLLWGPYLWSEGELGRKSDELIWKPSDFAGDGVHPSSSGRQKVARLLLDFVTHDPMAKPWFANHAGSQ